MPSVVDPPSLSIVDFASVSAGIGIRTGVACATRTIGSTSFQTPSGEVACRFSSAAAPAHSALVVLIVFDQPSKTVPLRANASLPSSSLARIQVICDRTTVAVLPPSGCCERMQKPVVKSGWTTGSQVSIAARSAGSGTSKTYSLPSTRPSQEGAGAGVVQGGHPRVGPVESGER